MAGRAGHSSSNEGDAEEQQRQLYGLPDDEARLAMELEFVQCLANPEYLHWLALNKYLEEPAFVRFLHYLCYWRRPEYARLLL
jgi:mediator of RNA polymerase II transcription subunit 31